MCITQGMSSLKIYAMQAKASGHVALPRFTETTLTGEKFMGTEVVVHPCCHMLQELPF